MPAAPGSVLGGTNSGDQRLGDAGVRAVQGGVAGDVGLLADLKACDVLAVAVDELLDERAVAVDVTRA
jgi:hypothetical protein